MVYDTRRYTSYDIIYSGVYLRLYMVILMCTCAPTMYKVSFLLVRNDILSFFSPFFFVFFNYLYSFSFAFRFFFLSSSVPEVDGARMSCLSYPVRGHGMLHCLLLLPLLLQLTTMYSGVCTCYSGPPRQHDELLVH